MQLVLLSVFFFGMHRNYNDFNHVGNKNALLRSLSTSAVEKVARASAQKEKHRHSYSLREWNTIANPLDMPKISETDEVKNQKILEFENQTYNCGCDTSNPGNDLSAMSVINLYESGENLDHKMDTTRDVDNDKGDLEVNRLNLKGGGSASKVSLNVIEEPLNMYNNVRRGNCPKPTIFFKDNIRSVDFVLVWNCANEDAFPEEARRKREIFQKNLCAKGLELEREQGECGILNFVKIHAPIDVLKTYSEILKLRMPMKEGLCVVPSERTLNMFDTPTSYFSRKIPAIRQVSHRTNMFVRAISDQYQKLRERIFIDKEKFPEKLSHRFTAIYRRDREYLFDTESPCFFTPAIHSRVVQFILDRTRFEEGLDNNFAFGMERLIADNVYEAAYPLHDGDLTTVGSTRNFLYNEWSSLQKWYKYQPLDCVKEYFGVKIALYFAWLGYYTHILIAPSVVGIACFIYSLSTMYSNKPSNDICNLDLGTKMCPLCDSWCGYWNLNETCVHSRITYLFDNPTTVFYAVFMSIWATTFLEMWKRYSAEITHRWDLTGFDVQEEHPRPQYLARLAHVKRKSYNHITNTQEPHVPFWKIRVPMTIFSFSMVLLLVCMALATVVGVVLYRMSVLVTLKFYSDKIDTSSAVLITTATAASINLVAILIFNQIYTYVAERLTEFELLRTQTEFDDSLTLKIYLLQFVNYYASIFYIAFFKGKFIGSPKRYNTFFGYRQEECGPGGCLLELCIQLAVIMIGKQAMNTVLEMMFPLFFKWLNTLKLKTGLTKEQQSCKGAQPQWLKDFKLVEWGPRSLFPEYLEMVLQYGFVTIFVAAFPLAPLFALLNNILEMRLDAKKLVTMYRRPVAQRMRDIGIWYRILDSIGKLSVITNGFIIAFTSDFIPRLVYRLYISKDGSLEGYLNNSLSYFNTSDFQASSRPKDNSVELCRYPEYRSPPWESDKYEYTALYWRILAARLFFVVIFENVVVFVMIAIKWGIPDMSSNLRNKIRREAYLTNEIIIKHEQLRAQSARPKPELSSPEQWDKYISRSLSNLACDSDDSNNGNDDKPSLS